MGVTSCHFSRKPGDKHKNFAKEISIRINALTGQSGTVEEYLFPLWIVFSFVVLLVLLVMQSFHCFAISTDVLKAFVQ